MNYTLVCEPSFDGIMTAVYDGWVLKNQGHQISIYPGYSYSPSFLSEYVVVATDNTKADKVAMSIRIKISVEAYLAVFRACMHYSTERADVVFNFLQLAYPKGADVMKMYGHPAVMRLLELSRKAVNEAHLFKGVVRFSELRGNVLYSRIEPRCDIIPLLVHHFEERFPEENWIIYDVTRKKAAVHPIKQQTVFVEGRDMDKLTKDMQYKDEYGDLWRIFFETIGIDARYNPKCQRNNLPLWYRKNMNELTNK